MDVWVHVHLLHVQLLVRSDVTALVTLIVDRVVILIVSEHVPRLVNTVVVKLVLVWLLNLHIELYLL